MAARITQVKRGTLTEPTPVSLRATSLKRSILFEETEPMRATAVHRSALIEQTAVIQVTTVYRSVLIESSAFPNVLGAHLPGQSFVY